MALQAIENRAGRTKKPILQNYNQPISPQKNS